MIAGFFIQIITAIFSFFLGLLPVSDMPTGWVDAVELIWGYIQSFSFLFPVDTIVDVLVIAVTFHLSLFAFDLSLKLLRLLRGA